MGETALTAESARAAAAGLGQTVAAVPDTPGAAWQPQFPSADMVEVAAGMMPAQPAGHVQEGPSWRITVSPGKVKVFTVDEARAERTDNRAVDARRVSADVAATWLAAGEEVPARTPSRRITGWSQKSRRNMVERLCDLDYAPLFASGRMPCMGTLTYPGCWLRVAPTGREVKKHLKALRKRYRRAFGEDLACVWKLEFQHRPPWKRCDCETCAGADDGRAPHIHMLLTPPLHAADDGRFFRQWLSETWADIVAHPDPEQRRRHTLAGTGVDFAEGLRATDPRRVAVYFTKHGSAAGKEYQHCVPQAWREPGRGPGRFWGYWALEPAQSTTAVSPAIGMQAGRTIRRWSQAQQTTHQVRRPRVKGGIPISKYPDVLGAAGADLIRSRTTVDDAGEPHWTKTYRTSRTRAVRARNGRGWVSLNNGPNFGTELGYWLHTQQQQHQTEQDRAELDRCGLRNTPLDRARRLPAGPRRDALIHVLAGKGYH